MIQTKTKTAEQLANEMEKKALEMIKVSAILRGHTNVEVDIESRNYAKTNKT